MMTEQEKATFLFVLSITGNECYINSRNHGFWPTDKKRNKGEMLALLHSEVSEMLEAVRKPHADKHCPDFSNEEIEAADVLIRLLDYTHGHKLRLGRATLAKMAFNSGRPFMHGKEF